MRKSLGFLFAKFGKNLLPLWDHAILFKDVGNYNIYYIEVRIISVKKLKDFWEEGYADAEQPLKVWYQICKQKDFSNPNEIKYLFPSASFINNNRVVFNISGNKYRLVVYIKYNIKIIYIRFIGTHAEYDRINAKEV